MKNRFLNVNLAFVFSLASANAIANPSVVTCIPEKTGKLIEMDEILESTRVILRNVNGEYSLDMVSKDGQEIYVEGARCTPDVRASGLLHLAQLVCVDEENQSMPVTYDPKKQRITLTSPWFPGGQIVGNCQSGL